MTTTSDRFEPLERVSSRLFVLAGVVLFVAGANYAVTSLLESVTFNAWVGLTVVVGRWLSLLAVAGLSVRIATRNALLGTVSKVLVAVAVVFTSGLVVTATLANVGVTTPVAAVFGLGTILLSILTYAVVGLAVLRTGAYAWPIGALLLVATAGLLWGFFGQMVLPEGLLGVIGTVAEWTLCVTHVAIGYRLRSAPGSTNPPEPVTDATP